MSRPISTIAAVEHDPAQLALAARYQQLWKRPTAHAPSQAARAELVIVLVRGLFGAWIPQHFKAPLRRLRALGWTTVIARTRPAGTVEHNQRLLQAQIGEIVGAGRRPLFLAHSKGGIEVLLALAAQPALAAATAGLVGVQTPRAGAPSLESLFQRAHAESRQGSDHWREPLERTLLTAAGARAACAEINHERVAAWLRVIDATRFAFPWLAVATHAGQSTPSIELRHRRLGRIAPGQPHDGVFFTADQVWPQAKMLLLPDIDHAQPSVGGRGFAHDRFWSTLLALLLDTDAMMADR